MAVVLGAGLVVAGVALRGGGRGGGSGIGIAAHNVDGPFGPFAGYLRVGDVRSVAASIRVPRIERGSPLGEAGTWIGVQGYGAPRRFIQIGVLEIRARPQGWAHPRNGYIEFWSDVRHGFRPAFLTPVHPNDVIRTSISLSRGRWQLEIDDVTTGTARRFSTAQETGGSFEQAEWVQEDPGTEAHHVSYPRLAAPVFSDLVIDGAKPRPSALYSQWMSVNGGNLGPSRVRNGGFTLVQAPRPSRAGLLFMRLSAASGSAFEQFEDERGGWTDRTPAARIAAAYRLFAAATRAGTRALEATSWPPAAERLLPVLAADSRAMLAAARPPERHTPAAFAAWNAQLTRQIVRGAPASAGLAQALGLPGSGPSYKR